MAAYQQHRTSYFQLCGAAVTEFGLAECHTHATRLRLGDGEAARLLEVPWTVSLRAERCCQPNASHFQELISALGAANTDLSSFSQGRAGVGVNVQLLLCQTWMRKRTGLKHWFSHPLDDLY